MSIKLYPFTIYKLNYKYTHIFHLYKFVSLNIFFTIIRINIKFRFHLGTLT